MFAFICLPWARISRPFVVAAQLISGSKERRDPPDDHTAVTPFGLVRWDEQELLAISLSDKVLTRHAESLCKQIRDRSRTPVREAQIVDFRAHRVGMAFHKKHLAGVVPRHIPYYSANGFEQNRLIRADIRRAELEIDRVDIDAPHAGPEVHACQDLVQGIAAVERFHGTGLKRCVDVILRGRVEIDDVLLPRDYDARRRESDHKSAQREAGTGGDGTVFKEHEAPPIGQITDAADRTAIGVDLHLNPHAVRPDNRRDRVAVWRTAHLRFPAVEPEVDGFIVLNEGPAIDLDDGAVPRLFNDRLTLAVNRLLALAHDRAHTLVLKPKALIDRGLAALLSCHLLLFCNEALAFGGVRIALRFSLLLRSGKFMTENGLLTAGLLLLSRSLLLLLVKLLLCLMLLLLELLNLGLIGAELGSVVLGFPLRCPLSFVLLVGTVLLLSLLLGLFLLLGRSLLLLRLLLSLSLGLLLLRLLLVLSALLLLKVLLVLGPALLLLLCLLLVLSALLLLKMLLVLGLVLLLLLRLLLVLSALLLLKVLLVLGLALLLLLRPLLLLGALLLLKMLLLLLGPALLLLLCPLLLLSLALLFLLLLLGRLRLSEEDSFLSPHHAGNHNEGGYGCQQERHDLHG
jgi:hypothetical protein